MKTWMPLTIAVVFAILLNAFPVFMAFVVRAEGWVEAGWAFYFLTIPAGLAAVLLGALASLFLYVRRRGERRE